MEDNMDPIAGNSVFIPYVETRRHWCPQAEHYTGLDSLVSAVAGGWVISGRVFRHETWRGGTRPTIVYYFELKRGHLVVTMPVISNPCVGPLIDRIGLEVITQTFWETARP